MGACFSCLYYCCGKQEDPSQFGEAGDRAQLINPSNDNATIQSENYYCRYIDSIFPKKSEEHSDLNKILQEMATNVIDVASLGSHSLEQHEYKDRMNYYMSKMRSFTLSKSLSKLPKHSILKDVLNPDKIFTLPCPIPSDELESICSILSEVDNMFEDLKIENSEDLIIPFQVQT